MTLHVPTILGMTLLFELLMASLMLQYRRHRKVYPGFAQWTLAGFALAAAYASYLVRPVVPLWGSVLGGAVASGLAVILRWDGVLRFTGQARLARAWYCVPVVLGVVMCGMVWSGVEAPYRNLLHSAVLAGCCLAYLRPLLTLRHGGQALCVAAASLSVVEVACLLARAVAWCCESKTGLFEPQAFQSVYFSVAMLCEVGLNVVFMLMNSQRLEVALGEARSDLAATLEGVRETMASVKVLRGLLSICSQCKKVQASADEWEPVEVYVSRHSEAEFSHGLCVECLHLHYGEYSHQAAPPPHP